MPPPDPADAAPLLGRAKIKIAGKALLAVLDQGAYAGGNFLLAVLLARSVTPASYGVFAFAYSFFWLASTVHCAFVTEPMLVYGASKWGAQWPAYFRELARWHWRLCAGELALFAVAGAALAAAGKTELALAFASLGLATPFILDVWLLRRACFVESRPRLAAEGSALYLGVVAAVTLSVPKLSGQFAVSWVFLGLAAGNALLGLWLRMRMALGPANGTVTGAEVVAQHWKFGRWAIGGSLLSWVPTNFFYVLLPASVSLESAGALRALMNLIQPAVQGNGALALYLVPWLARRRGAAGFGRIVAATVTLQVGAAVIYWLLLAGFAGPIMTALYRGRYDAWNGLLWVLGLIPVATGAIAAIGTVARAVDRPEVLTFGYLAAAVATVTLGNWLMARYGLWGAATGMVAAMSSVAVVGFVMMPRLIRRATTP